MPAIRRRERRRHEDFQELTKEQRRHLLHGKGYFRHEFTDAESFSFAWEIHREKLLSEFIRIRPGRRPFGWWFCDHQKERPIVGTWMSEDELRQNQDHIRPSQFGFLHTSMIAHGEPLQQDETEYLIEHGLLSPEELV